MKQDIFSEIGKRTPFRTPEGFFEQQERTLKKAISSQPSVVSKLLIPGRQDHSTHVFHQYTLRVVGTDRDRLREQLAERGIPSMIYYPVPLHQQVAYRDPRYRDGDFPVAERLAACVLSLPMHTELDNEQLEYITSNVLELVK